MPPINADDLPSSIPTMPGTCEHVTRLNLQPFPQAKILYATQAIQACLDAGDESMQHH
jgi:hypothetical protein